ncbi:MAG: hypothetical protein GX938_09200 [Spirochaetales bacterium]|nr:hypothetical protein [Spirochaetales bacterium]
MAEIIDTLKERQARKGLPFGMWGEAEYFADLVGKRVVIVGPAGYVQGMGEVIDSYDVVVRVNHALPIAFPEDYGTRTDVLYHILSHRGGTSKTVVTQEEVASWDCEWIVSRHAPRSARIRRVGPYLEGRKWTAMSHEFFFTVRKEIGSLSPNTGVSAIAHLLLSDLKSLDVIGFDFYRSGVYKGYGDVGEKENALRINENWHDTDAQLRYLAVLQRRDNRLHFDETLKEIINECIGGNSRKARKHKVSQQTAVPDSREADDIESAGSPTELQEDCSDSEY